MANPTLLFYNLDNETGKKLKFLCLKHKIKIRVVQKSQYPAPIGSLIGLISPENAADKEDSCAKQQDFNDEMLVFCGFPNQLLDAFLLEFKKNRIPRIALKAVLTEQNLLWNSYVLHDELEKEHQTITQQYHKN